MHILVIKALVGAGVGVAGIGGIYYGYPHLKEWFSPNVVGEQPTRSQGKPITSPNIAQDNSRIHEGKAAQTRGNTPTPRAQESSLNETVLPGKGDTSGKDNTFQKSTT